MMKHHEGIEASSPISIHGKKHPVLAEDCQEIPEDAFDAESLTTEGSLLHQTLEQAVRQCGNKIAIICGDSSLTFTELNGNANRIAHVLQERGIQKGDIVGVALERSTNLVVVLIAVLKTGAAYVPIDPDLPMERISQMMEDASPKMVITDDHSLLASTCWEDISLYLDPLLSAAFSDGVANHDLGVRVRHDDLAYIMYTSGSTGRPKGVEIRHGSVANLLRSIRKEPGCDESDRLLAVTTISFDMAVVELFLPMTCEATTVIAKRREVRDPAELIKLMKRHGITIMQATPTTWRMLLESGWQGQPRLRKIFCGGEALSRRLADRLMVCSDMMWNMYGPTEATVYASIWKVCQDQKVVIGRPVHNCRLYVLNEDLSPAPVGQPGELYIGGAGVARGYRNRPGLNRSSFVLDPFQAGVIYRTGDLACFLPSGELSLLGRTDRQVKLRGYRVELGDIEAALVEHEAVSDAIAIYREDRLIAYYVLKSSGNAREPSTKTAFERTLNLWLAERLPTYMVPAFLVELETIPVTFNGKIDHKTLPDPVKTPAANDATKSATHLERHLLVIWSQVLGHDRIGIDDNFFEIGGDSVRLVRVNLELQKLLGQSIPIATLFEHFTIKTLAEHLNGHQETSIPLRQPSHSRKDEDIAIVSLSCRLPGGIDTPEDFWQLLESGGDAITDVPTSRWDGTTMKAQGNHSHRGGFISSVGSFDLSVFGISPREASSLDPAQYMMLETCWEGFERAGYTRKRLRGSQTGVFIGTSNILAHLGLNASAVRDPADLNGYTTTGSAGGTMSGRISHQLDLWGPTITVDTACSSSLVTTHLACTALRQGDCDMAVSGGISLILNPGLHVEFSQLQGMASDGRCRSFDSNAQGTGWSEGCAVVILKRLSDAQRDNDTIHAVIKGTAINHDGRSATLTTPSGAAQQRLVQSALNAAGLRPEDIDYVEAHGTATKLGDPIEATALGELFGPSRPDTEKPLLIGSAKSNIGHTQAAAGLVGLLKVILSMQHHTLPQTLHVIEPTPAVDWKMYHMTPSINKQSWLPQRGRLRRAGISAFGIGGTNAHAIIEEAPKQSTDITPANDQNEILCELPFLLSGDSDAALRAQVDRLSQYLRTAELKDSSMQNIAYSLATSRDHHRNRLVLTAAGQYELIEKLDFATSLENLERRTSIGLGMAPKLAIMFTGQGSQWPGMGKDLCEMYPIFRTTLQTVAAEFTELDVPLLQVMWAEPGSAEATLLSRTDFAQASLFALEIALWRLWQSWGVHPEFVIGHSLGEIVAAHVAGVFDLNNVCRLVAARGRLMEAQQGDFMMVSLEAGASEVSKASQQLSCVSSIEIAAYNAPIQTVVSGITDAVQKVVKYFVELGRKSTTLSSEYAFHSRFMDNMLGEFQGEIETLDFNPPQLEIVSSMDGKLVKATQLEHPDYWVQQVRNPVRFREGIEELARQGANIFLEVGPQSVLCGMGAACLSDQHDSDRIAWLPSLRSPKDSITCLQRSLAELHTRDVHLDWDAYFEPFNCRRVQLPAYAFQRDFTVEIATPTSSSVPKKELANQIRTPPRSRQSLKFEVIWQPAKMGYSHMHDTWGLLPSCKSHSSWGSSVKSALQHNGIRLIDVNLDQLRTTEKLTGLICLWDSEPTLTSQMEENAVKSLAQLQKAVHLQLKLPLVWITRGAIGTGLETDDQYIRPEASPLWGLMRSAQREHPELQLRLVDVDEELSNLVASALKLDSESECAVRKDRILIPQLQAFGTTSASPVARKLTQNDGAVLITGGLGYIGSQIARWLARQHGVQDLVLVSRRGLDTQGANELVSELSALGARVTVLGFDIVDPEGIRTIMATFGEHRRLRGVIHAAGTSDPGVLTTLTPERCVKTLAPKVSGAWLLHQAVQHVELDFFVMLSSISGVLGMPGLASYSAANTSMDALAHSRHARGLPATSVAYGTWMGDGMAARLSENTHSNLAHLGLDPLTPEQGFELLEEAVLSNRPLTVAAALDPDRLRTYFGGQGGTPSLLRPLLQTNETRDPVGQDKNLQSRLDEAELHLHTGIVLDMTQKVVAKFLGFKQPQEADVDRPLQNLGIDSLTAIQVRNQLKGLTGLELSANMVMLCPTIRALSQTLLSHLSEQAKAHKPKTISTVSQLISTATPECSLDSSLTFENATRDPTRSTTRPKTILLTGATGFVGAFVLHELLKRGIATYCLVRANSPEQAQERLTDTLEDYGLWNADFASSIKPLVGDIGKDLLGLAAEVFDELTHEIDAICHCGGLVDWMRPMEDYIGPNVVSTHEILRLASRGCAKSVHLVSTISTLPNHMGLILVEGDREYGYGTSKYIAERLVAAARWRGADATIYRLPYVAASAATGHFRRDKGDFLHNLVSGCLIMGAFPSLDADMSMVLPVDYLSNVIVSVMTQDVDKRGQDFDFLSSRAPTCNAFFRQTGEVSSEVHQQILPFQEWKQMALNFAISHPTSPVARIAAVLDGYTEETAASMFKGPLVGRNVLGGSVYSAPPLDEQFLRRYLGRIRTQIPQSR